MGNILREKYTFTQLLAVVLLSTIIYNVWPAVINKVRYEEPNWVDLHILNVDASKYECQVISPVPYAFTVQLTLEPHENGTTQGLWEGNENRVTLYEMHNWTDINTVSHEASHAVDTYLERNPGLHWHYEAYLQGAFTECIYTIGKTAYDNTGAE